MVQHLKSLGLEAEHVGNLGLATATDEMILAEACARDAIVVTLDADFHSLLARDNSSRPSVIRIRMEGLKGEDAAIFLDRVVQRVKGDLQAGAAVTATSRRLALRRLPLR
jgi:predicted nuclease of predicted toxin-antitoxin system